MSSYVELPEADVREMLRLVREVQQADGPVPRWQCLLAGLCRLVKADIGIMARITRAVPQRQPWATAIVEAGSPTESEKAFVLRRFETHEWVNPSQGGKTNNTPCDGAWYFDEDQGVENRSLFGVGRALESGVFFGLGLQRRPDNRCFASRDRILMELFHSEVDWVYQSCLSFSSDKGVASLSPRLRQTLQRLTAGESEKQIANYLGLSHHTVHDYVKALYRHFNVSSRGELLARCVLPFSGEQA